jgi:hypothetical protein
MFMANFKIRHRKKGGSEIHSLTFLLRTQNKRTGLIICQPTPQSIRKLTQKEKKRPANTKGYYQRTNLPRNPRSHLQEDRDNLLGVLHNYQGIVSKPHQHPFEQNNSKSAVKFDQNHICSIIDSVLAICEESDEDIMISTDKRQQQ